MTEANPKESGHTPTPWRVDYDDNGFFFIDAPGRLSPYIVATGGEGEGNEANAEFIVRAVNSFDALVAALEEIVRKDTRFEINNTSQDTGYDGACGKIARAALKLARGEQ